VLVGLLLFGHILIMESGRIKPMIEPYKFERLILYKIDNASE
jgi:hypothetical protein